MSSSSAHDEDAVLVGRIEGMRSEILADFRARPDDDDDRVPRPVTIVPNWLYVGGSMIAKDTTFLNDFNICHVLNCADASAKGRRALVENRRYKELCGQDNGDYRLLAKHMNEAHEFIRSAGSEPVLVHCHAGLNRSVAIVVSYIMKYGLSIPQAPNEHPPHGIMTSLEDAVRLVLRQRPFALTNESFVYQLVDWERSLTSRADEMTRIS